MPQQDFFVRQPESEDAAGPYSIEKLVSLAEIGRLRPETLYYDESLEEWKALQDDAALKARLFPEKRKLSLRLRKDEEEEEEEAPTAEASAEPVAEGDEAPSPPPPRKPLILSKADKERPAVTVQDLLAAAEAETEETRHIKEIQREEEKGALLGLQMLSLAFLLSAASFIYPTWIYIAPLVDGAASFTFAGLLENPFPVFLAVDLLLGLFLLLGMTETYPVLRIRSIMGMGYFGFMGYAAMLAGSYPGAIQGVAAVGFAAGVIGLTLNARLRPVILSSICAILGVLAYAGLSLYPLLS